jgi:aspartate-semialdehyde dehydrogenase
MKIAVVGATGLVGSKMLQVLAERKFNVSELLPVASERSVGQLVTYLGTSYPVVSMADAIAAVPDIALFSGGGAVSKEWATAFTAVGCRVIDNSSAWRMDTHVPLIVPEVNAHVLKATDMLIANPNCSTIQLVVALEPLHKRYGIVRVVVSTYQSVTGTGKKAVDQLMSERAGSLATPVYPHPIDLNVLPHIDVFMADGYTKEEVKIMQETQKIMGDTSIAVTATTVRVPVIGGHSESVNIELGTAYELDDLRSLLAQSPGIIVTDNPAANEYPMPIHAHDRDEVFVGRIRRDDTRPNTLNMWIVSDNLRKGAATNAVQIAEYIVNQGWVKGY